MMIPDFFLEFSKGLKDKTKTRYESVLQHMYWKKENHYFTVVLPFVSSKSFVEPKVFTLYSLRHFIRLLGNW